MLKAAIIGCGKIAGGYEQVVPPKEALTHAGAYALCDDVELIAIADSDQRQLEQFQEKWDVTKTYSDYKTLLANESVDILSVCAPTNVHFEIVKEASNYPISAFYIEKPLSYSLVESQEIGKLLKNKIVSVNYFRRWNPVLRCLCEDFKKNKYGQVIKVSGYYSKGMIHNASHIVDFLYWIWGMPKEKILLKSRNISEVDCEADFYLQFKDKIDTFILNVSGAQYAIWEIDFLTDRARITIAQRGHELLIYKKEQDPDYQMLNRLILDSHEIIDWQDCTTRAVKELVQCLKDRNTQTSSTLKEAVMTQEILNNLLSQRTQ